MLLRVYKRLCKWSSRERNFPRCSSHICSRCRLLFIDFTDIHKVNEGELEKIAVVRNFRTAEADGKNYDVQHYNLDVIISVGYRVKSQQGTQFRIWATQRLKEYIVKGFALNDDRFKIGNSLNYFKKLQESIREIRLSERFFYQKIKYIYTTF